MKFLGYSVLLALLLVLPCQLYGQRHPSVVYAKADSLWVTGVLRKAQRCQPGTCMPLFFARQLVGRPYVGHTLEGHGGEPLVVNTRQLDCTTLVETVTALVLCVQSGQSSFSDFAANLCRLRYRRGVRQGYTSRLHYFTDWILDNEQLGLVREHSSKCPPFNAVQTVRVSYMSAHPQKYIALRSHPEDVAVIARTERAVSGRRFRYIPKGALTNSRAVRNAVHDGDIIAITCNRKGLDIAHVGFAVWKRDGLHLLNASSVHKKVVEEPMTLRRYLFKHPSHTGIRVVRIKQ